jgi:outer membrane protein
MRFLFFFCVGLSFSVSATADDLMSLYARAVLSSPELQGSEFALDIAKAQEDQAFSKLLPRADLSGNYSMNRLHNYKKSTPGNPSVSTYPGKRATLSVRQPLFDLQAYLLLKSQESGTKQSEENLVSAQQKLIFDLVERYIDALEAQDKSKIIAAELSSNEKQLVRVKAMQERQMVTINDFYELQARVETLHTQLIDTKNDAQVALEKLRELTGDEVKNLKNTRLDVILPPPASGIETWVEQAEQINPELLALKHAAESAQQSISAYQSGHLPRIELQANGNYSDTVYNNLQSNAAYDVGSLAVEAVIPLYQGGAITAKVKESEARHGLSLAKVQQKQRELEKMIRAAFLDMATSPARCRATDQEVAASEKARDSMEKGYELGVVTIVHLLKTQEQLSEARKAQSQSRLRYFKARSALLYQAGLLVVEELAKLNSWLAATTQ